MVGYGDYGDVNTGELPSLGDRLAGVANAISPGLVPPYSPSLYTTLEFEGLSSPYSDPIHALNYDSGSPWFDSNGDLDLIDIGSTLGLQGYGASYGLDLGNQQVQSYIQQPMINSWNSVPEPSSIELITVGALILGGGLLARKAHLSSQVKGR